MEAYPDPTQEPAKPASLKARSTSVQPEPPSESEGDPSSEDEYVADQKTKGKNASKVRTFVLSCGMSFAHMVLKRRVRRPSFSDGSDSSASDDNGRSHSRRLSSGRVSASPIPSSLKRKTPNASQPPPPKKRRGSEIKATDDPARKYCLAKLEELFRDIFFKYPRVRMHMLDGEEGSDPVVTEKKAEELTEGERAQLLEGSKQFATELEQCMYEIYSEPDKQGLPSAGGRYKCVY